VTYPVPNGAWVPQMPPPPVPNLASFGRRFGGFLIDVIGVGIVGLIIAVALNLPGTTTTVDSANGASTSAVLANSGWSSLLIAGLSACYFIGMWISSGATIGQRMLGLHVYTATGPQNLPIDRAAIRWFLLYGVADLVGAISIVAPETTGLVGLVQLGWIIALAVTTYQSPTKQGVHDRYAGSVVVKQ
jgi:uncharacterized RDD family membrane protein YckC